MEQSQEKNDVYKYIFIDKYKMMESQISCKQ